MVAETLPKPPAWPRVDITINPQIKNHRKGGLLFGGGGGNRTRVQKSSTDSSTYLVLSFEFNLTDAGTHAAAKRVT